MNVRFSPCKHRGEHKEKRFLPAKKTKQNCPLFQLAAVSLHKKNQIQTSIFTVKPGSTDLLCTVLYQLLFSALLIQKLDFQLENVASRTLQNINKFFRNHVYTELITHTESELMIWRIARLFLKSRCLFLPSWFSSDAKVFGSDLNPYGCFCTTCLLSRAVHR